MAMGDHKLMLYAPLESERLSFTVHIIFERLVGIPCIISSNRETYIRFSGPKISYSNTPIASGELRIPDSGLLWETGVRPIHLQAAESDHLPALFPIADPAATWQADVLAMAFFLLARYEEYLPFQPDEHGRFMAKHSAADWFGFLERPLLNEWALEIRKKLSNNYAIINFTPPKYSFQLTYDIDMAWAFKNKGAIRQLGGFFKDVISGKPKWLAKRLAVLAGLQSDPFYTFDYLDDCHRENGQKPPYFFLLGDWGAYDHNTYYQNPAFQKLIKKISTAYPVGIHPSYRSTQHPELLTKELNRLAGICGQPVMRSRQHYLRLTLPDTYRHLLANGILADYSLGYADAIGFRASVAIPFPWYDLMKEMTTPLILHPFSFMDVTLKDYMGLSPTEAIGKIEELQATLKSCGGILTGIWHNSSFSALHGWEGWATVHQKALGGQSSP